MNRKPKKFLDRCKIFWFSFSLFRVEFRTMPGGRIRGPAECAIAKGCVRLARNNSRRGSQGNCGNIGEELGCQGRSGFGGSGAAKCDRSCQNKNGRRDDRFRRGVTGPHRAIGLPGSALGIAEALIFLHIVHLEMVQRAIDGVAACRQIGAGKRLRQGGDARQEECQKGRDGCEFAHDDTQFYTSRLP